MFPHTQAMESGGKKRKKGARRARRSPARLRMAQHGPKYGLAHYRSVMARFGPIMGLAAWAIIAPYV